MYEKLSVIRGSLLSIALTKSPTFPIWEALKIPMGILSASHIGNVGDLVNAIDNNEPLITESFSYTINSPKHVLVN